MVKLTFYGGVNQIGGNKILLEDGDARLFFDFGTSFDERGRFYEEFLNPRPAFGLLDPLTMGLLPPLEGLYREDLEPPTSDLWTSLRGAPNYLDLRPYEIHGVLLSHAHLDHTGYLSFLRPEIPAYASALTAFMAKAIQDGSQANFESEVVYLVPRVPNETGLLKTSNYRSEPARQRPFKVFSHDLLTDEAHTFWRATPGSRELEPVPITAATDIEGLEIRSFPVDHSVPGASAYAVKTSAGWIGYTGDLRLHGSQKASTQAYLKKMAALKPVALLCEGTRTEVDDVHRANYTEADVEERSLREVRSAKGLVIADFGPRNVERLLIFARIGREAGRGLVILPKDAYLLDAIHLAEPSIPSIADLGNLYVYEKPTLSALNWEKQVREVHSTRLVSPADIQANQGQYILCFSFFDLNDLPSIRPGPGSLYLYSSHEAFNEELQLDFQRLRNWIDHFDMNAVGLPLKELEWKSPPEEQDLHASGHASPQDLLTVAREISPEVLVPIHTQRPEFFEKGLADTDIKVDILPGKGASLAFG